MKQILIGMAVFLVACCPCRRGVSRVDLPLEGTTWQLVQFDGRVQNTGITFVFDAERRVLKTAGRMTPHICATLDEITRHEVDGTMLILFTDGDSRMIFEGSR